jgi:DNA (cytosine-5)-methyltransferase 1
LDLFSGAGGAARGYQAAGFHVTGVDNRPQPRFAGDEFVLGDALEYLAVHGREYDAIHASPPCHDHTTLSSRAGTDGSGWLLRATRKALDTTGRPWVIENVVGAPMRPDVILCGELFGLRTIRHRWFELGGWWVLCPMHPPHTARTSTRKRMRDWLAGMHVSVTGDVSTYLGREAMGIDWMTGAELAQAIPPVYTRWLGERLLANLTPARVTAQPGRVGSLVAAAAAAADGRHQTHTSPARGRGQHITERSCHEQPDRA